MDWVEFEPLESDRGRPMIMFDTVVDRGEIPGIIAEWKEAVAEYFRFQRYGTPYGRGYLEWPCNLVDLFDEIASAEAVKYKELYRRGHGAAGSKNRA